MKKYCLDAIGILSKTNQKDFGKVFVELRIGFAHKYSKGYIFSTFHGTEFFENVINCLNGMEWEEKGEYGDNFRKFIKLNI